MVEAQPAREAANDKHAFDLFRACQHYHRSRWRGTIHWEFSHIEHINGFNSRDYCEQLAGKVNGVYEGRPGNMRVICMDDQGVTT